MSQRVEDLHREIDVLRRKIAEMDRHLKEKDHIINNQAKMLMQERKKNER